MRLLTMFLFLSYNSYAICPIDTENQGINALVDSNGNALCDIIDKTERDIILNTKIQKDEEIKSSSLNLKYVALHKALKKVSVPNFDISLLSEIHSNNLEPSSSYKLDYIYNNMNSLSTREYTRNSGSPTYRIDGFAWNTSQKKCFINLYDVTNNLSYGGGGLFDHSSYAKVTGGYTLGELAGSSENPYAEDICESLYMFFKEKLTTEITYSYY